jgi:hypothetical protein
MYYKEKQDLVWWVKYLFLIGIGGILLGLVLSPKDPETPFWLTPLLILIGLLLIFMYVNFRSLEVKVQGRSLEFGFGIFKKRFSLSDIISCEETTITFGEFLGIGIRRGFDGTICYNTRFGKGVRIKTKGKVYVLTSNNPQALCEALKAR